MILLGILFAISLVAELLCNSRPLFLRVNDRVFFPFVRKLTQRDLLGEEAEATPVNYAAFIASPAFSTNPANRVVWAPVPYSPGDVVDAATLRHARTVRVSVVPEVHVGRINLLRDGTIVRPQSVALFFPETTSFAGTRLDVQWRLTEALRDALTRRFDGLTAPQEHFDLEHAIVTGLTARVTLPECAAVPRRRNRCA